MTLHFYRTCLEIQNRPSKLYALWLFDWCSLCQRNGGLNSGPKSANIVTDALNHQIFWFLSYSATLLLCGLFTFPVDLFSVWTIFWLCMLKLLKLTLDREEGVNIESHECLLLISFIRFQIGIQYYVEMTLFLYICQTTSFCNCRTFDSCIKDVVGVLH